jgi:hypothetical protein
MSNHKNTGHPPPSNNKSEDSPQQPEQSDWFEETIRNLKGILHRVFLVLGDLVRLLWDPKKLLADEKVISENSLRPLVFFAFSVPLAILLIYADRLLETELSLQRAPNGHIHTADLLGTSAGRLVEVLNSPDMIIKLLLFGFLGGLTLNAIISKITKVENRDIRQATTLYVLGLSLVAIIIGIEIAVDTKRFLVWAFPGRIGAFLGDPYSLGGVPTALMMLGVIALCTRVIYHSLSGDNQNKRFQIAAVTSFF